MKHSIEQRIALAQARLKTATEIAERAAKHLHELEEEQIMEQLMLFMNITHANPIGA